MFTTKIESRKLTPENKTCISTHTSVMLSGLMVKKGSKVLCADGKVRSLSHLAHTPDTFFSTPAGIRLNGKYVHGYMTAIDCSLKSMGYKKIRKAFIFCPHTEQPNNTLPDWPEQFSEKLWDILGNASETVDNI